MSEFIPQTKVCSDCAVVKPRSAFSLRTISRDGLSHICKTCVRRRYDERLVAAKAPKKKAPPKLAVMKRPPAGSPVEPSTWKPLAGQFPWAKKSPEAFDPGASRPHHPAKAPPSEDHDDS